MSAGLATTGAASGFRRVLVMVSIGVVGYSIGAALPEFRAAGQAVRDASRILVGLALVLELGAVLSLPQVYRTGLQALGGRLTYREALQVSMGAFTLTVVLPGGGAAGGVFAARRITQFGNAAAVAAAAVGVAAVGTMATLCLLVVTSASAAAAGDGLRGPSLALAAVTAGLLAAALLAVRSALRSAALRERLSRLAERVVGPATATVWRTSIEDLATRPLGRRQLAPIAFWSALKWGSELAALWVMFLAFGVQLPVGVLVLGFGVANLLTALPHTPGGLGIVEAGMTGAYVAAGVAAPVALGAVLGYRMVSCWLPAVAGLPQLLRHTGGGG